MSNAYGGGSSTTPPITVPIQSHVINAKEIADEIFQAFQAGLRKVMASKEFKTGMVKTFQHLGKTIEKSMANVGNTISDQITKSLTNAAKSGASAFSHMLPNSVAKSVDRLIQNFDRLDAVIAGLGKPNASMEHTLAQLNKTIARTTTEASRQQTAAQNTAMQQQAANANASAKKRVAIIQFMAGQIRALERGLGSVVKYAADLGVKAVRLLASAWKRMGESARAGARAAAAAMRQVATAVANVVRGVARLSAGLASGFARGFAGISRSLVGALRRDESALRSSLSRRERAVSASASRQSSLLSRVTSGQAIAGLAGGVGIGSILTGGFERFANVERLQFQFERLLGSETAAAAMLERISEFARTTSFDLTGIAGLATNFVAMGQSADQSMQSIERLADVTAFAGGNTDSLERIQRALGQIISTGRLQGDELNQLAENLPGINIRKIIADQMGVSTAELAKMQEAGEIDAETFINAFLTGIDDPRFNGAAQEIAKTLSGRLANLKETFDIFGASLVGLVADPLREGMEEVTDILTKFGDFISGEMFKPKPGAVNPFKDLSDDTMIMFEDLPEEFQKQLVALGEGWGPGMWVDARGAEEWWDNNNPPEAEEAISNLEKFRDILGDFAKGAGGFLAFAGGLKLLGALFAFLVSPLTILTGLFGLLSALWGRMLKSSMPLRMAVDILGDRLHFLWTTLKDTVSIVTKLVGTALFGDSDFFGKMTEKVKGFVQELSKGVGEFSGWLTESNKLLEDGKVAEVIDSASQSLQGYLSNILGLTDAERDLAQVYGGNDFLNIFTMFLDKLENVPVLGPIVRFVRRVVNTIANAVRGFAGFISDIWHDMFGGGDQDRNGLMGGVEGFMYGSQSEESVGSRVLNRLEDTFLGPVVRFFRGPFADAVENVGEFVGGLFNALFNPEEGTEDDAVVTRVADFLSEHGLKGLVDFLRGDALSTAWNNVTNFFRPAVEAVMGVIQSAHDVLAPIVQPILDWVQDLMTAFGEDGLASLDLGNIALGAGVGLLAGSLLGGPLGGIAGAGIGAAFGAGLGGAIVDSLGVAWEMISPALADLWSNIKEKLGELFSSEKLINLATLTLNLATAIGKAIGNVIFDPYFLGAIASIAAAAALLAAAFIAGLGQALIDNVDQIAGYISDALVAGWEAMEFLDFIPDPIADAISGVLGNDAVGVAITAGLGFVGVKVISAIAASIATAGKNTKTGQFSFTTLGSNIATSLIGAISRPFQQLWRGGVSLFTNKKFQGGVNQTSALGKSVYASTGEVIGSGIAAGIAVGFAGYAAAKSGSAGGVILSLLAGTGTGAAIGSVFGPPGAAIGAVLGLAAAGVGAFFGNAQKQAEEAKAAVEEFAGAIANAGEEGARQVVIKRFVELEGVGDFLTDFGGFDVTTFTDRFFDGVTSGGEEAARVIENVRERLFTAMGEGTLVSGTELDALNHMAEVVREMGDEFEGGDALREPAFLSNFSQAEMDAINSGLEKLGLTWDDLKGGMSAVDGLADDLTAGLGGVNEVAEITADTFTSVGDATDEIAAALANGATLEGLIALIDTKGAGLETEEKLAAISAASELVAEKADEAKAALSEVFGGIGGPETEEDLRRGFRIDVRGIQAQIEGVEQGPGYADDLEEILDDSSSLISDAFTDAVDAGLIVDPATFNTFVDAVQAEIKKLPEGELKNRLQAGLDELTGSEEVAAFLEDMADGIRNNTTLEAAAADLAARVQTAFSNATAGRRGGGHFFAGAEDEVAAMGSGGGATDTSVTVPTNIDVSGFSKPGEEASKVFGEGFESKESELVTTMSSTVGSAAKTMGAVGAIIAAISGARIGKAASAGVEAGKPAMVWAGAQLAAGLGQGIASMGWFARLQAALVAASVIATVRRIFGIRSPSTVFIGIGHDVGEGFMQGIADMEGDMMSAISSALEESISNATSSAQAAAAEAGAAIFQAMFPSTLPGGTTTLDITSARAAIAQQVGGFGAGARDAAAASFGTEENAAVNAAARAMQGMAFQMRLSFGDLADDYSAAIGRRNEINSWAQKRKALDAAFQSHTLGWREFNEQVAELQIELRAGLISQSDYNDAVATLTKKLNAGILNQEAYEEALAELGDAPAPLTREELNLISSGPGSLNPATIAGIANAETINTALDSIAAWAQAALEAGYSVGSVQTTVNSYIATLQAQAKAAGLSTAEVNKLITAMGLMPTQIAAWVAGLTSLNAATLEGQVNIQMINEQLAAIRDYGVTLLEAGFSATTVRAELIKLRDELVRQATAFGFNTAQINALVEAAGLSNSALAAFILEMQAFATAAKDAEKAAAAAAAAEKLLADERAAAAVTPIGRPSVENLNIYIPYGDPEAVGMAAANRIAYGSLTSW